MKLIVASHRRSGTHLMIETIKANYGLKFKDMSTNTDIVKTHSDYEHAKKMKDDLEETEECKMVYVVRDGRDALVSCYDWWNNSGESHYGGVMPVIKQYGLSEYVQGKISPIEILNNYNLKKKNVEHPWVKFGIQPWELKNKMFSDPVGFWKSHVESFLNTDVPTFRYEDLLKEETIVKIGRKLGLELVREPYVMNKGVGYNPSQERFEEPNTGKWKGRFSKRDKEYFDKKALSTLKKLYEPR